MFVPDAEVSFSFLRKSQSQKPPYVGRLCSCREQKLNLSFPTVPETMRLVGGPGRCKGRLEVKHQEQWGTVCKAGWNLSAAKVVCRQLRCGKATLIKRCCNKDTQGQGVIWLSSVSCSGQEENLHYCLSGLERNNNCTHDEDTWVECEGNAYKSSDQVYS